MWSTVIVTVCQQTIPTIPTHQRYSSHGYPLVLVRVKQVSTLSLSFLVSRPGAKWNIEVHQEECDGEVEEDQDQVEIVTEEVPILTTEEPVKGGIT